jgi:dCTP deaminase
MIINGKLLLSYHPIIGMQTEKKRFSGTSYGLAEAGYDLQIDQDISFYPRTFWGGPRVDVTSYDNKYGHPNTTKHAGRFCLANAMEEFQMPLSLVGVVHDKSTWARKSLSVFNTVIEPGWNGYLTLELVFHGEEEVHIKRGQGIAQVLFTSLAENGNYENGKYQNQERRPYAAIEKHDPMAPPI